MCAATADQRHIHCALPQLITLIWRLDPILNCFYAVAAKHQAEERGTADLV